MSKKKQTFVDPQTGEEMGNPWIAHVLSGMVWGLLGGLIFVLVCGIVGSPFWGWKKSLIFGGALVLPSVFTGIIRGLLRWGQIRSAEPLRFEQAVCDHITLWWYGKKSLRHQEHPNVPDGALSQARTLGEPVPTAAALSLAKDSEEPERLMGEVEVEESIEVEN